MGKTIGEAWWRQHRGCRVLWAGCGCPSAPGGHGSLATRHGRKADHSSRRHSAVRVVPDGRGVVAGEQAIEAAHDDPFGKLKRRRCGGDAWAQMAQDRLDPDAAVATQHRGVPRTS